MARTRQSHIEIFRDHAEIVLYNSSHRETGRAIIDREDVERVSNIGWYLSDRYVAGVAGGKLTRLHRYLMNQPDGMMVDHINHNRMDNRRINLRVCTAKENMENRSCRKYMNESELRRYYLHGWPMPKGAKIAPDAPCSAMR